MKRANGAAEVMELVTRYMLPGALTNNHMQAAQYYGLAESGALYICEFAGGLFLLLAKKGRYELKYHITDASIPSDIALPERTVAEIAWKAGGEERAAEASAYLEKCGLAPALNRRRFKLGKEDAASSGAHATLEARNRASGVPSPRIATSSDREGLRMLLIDSFNSLTGCLPEDEELSKDIAEGCVLCVTGAGGESDNLQGNAPKTCIAAESSSSVGHAAGNSDNAASPAPLPAAGLLRFARRQASLEIAHLAVREDMRGRGISGKLLEHFISNRGGLPVTVWVNEGNIPAERAYSSSGFTPDGLRSVVLHNG
ncbi:MAG: GNAT family N-acetyltransferase [Oscillospiraceae bacterium]|nr:GNAT family N-acetyltransferase [Oscillospiraceae bacterium]